MSVMMTHGQYDQLVERAQIAILVKLKYRPGVIAKKMGVALSTVYKVLGLMQSRQPMKLFPGTSPGRPQSKAMKQCVVVLKHAVKGDGVASLRDLHDKVEDVNGQRMNRTGMQRALQAADLRAYRLQKRPRVSEPGKIKRVLFAVEHMGEDFGSWVWVDEVPVHLFLNKKVFVYAHSKPNAAEHHLPTCHSGGGHLMVWGAIGLWGKARLRFVDDCTSSNPETKRGNLDAPKYINLLEEALQDIQVHAGPLSTLSFAQDNAPSHIARITRSFLHSKRIEIIDWPPYSPDLNPIENVWSILKYRLSMRNIADFHDLRKAIEAEWDALSDQTIRDCCMNMDDRLMEVIQNGGLPTDY